MSLFISLFMNCWNKVEIQLNFLKFHLDSEITEFENHGEWFDGERLKLRGMVEFLLAAEEYNKIFRFSRRLPNCVKERLKEVLIGRMVELVCLAGSKYHVEEVFFIPSPGMDDLDLEAHFLPVELRIFSGLEEKAELKNFVAEMSEILSSRSDQEIAFDYEQVWFPQSQVETVPLNHAKWLGE